MHKLILILLITFNALAQDIPAVAVGDAEIEKDNLLMNFISSVKESDKAPYNKLLKILKDDFSFYKHKFNFIDKLPIKAKNTEYLKLRESGTRYIAELKISSANDGFEVKGTLIDSFDEETNIISKLVTKENFRRSVHSLANSIYKGLTGKKSIFETSIVFVSDFLTSKRVRIKEVYMMDFDGGNKKKVTNHGGLVVSPAISNSKDKVAYSLIKESSGRRNVDLYMKNLKDSSTEKISGRYGINSGAVFSSDDKNIYLTLSTGGNTDIYRMDLDTKKKFKLTKHFSEDVDPSVTEDGKILTFLSSRPGKASIYTLNIENDKPKGLKRISYVGQFNATPRFNPDGTEIAFSSWLDNRFDIFRINTNGTGLVRLTKNFGSNEDPSYSLDGEFMVFSSQVVVTRKKAIQNLYIMNRNGEILKKITSNFGNCQSPRWSK
jgi:TolB protein